MNRIAVVDTSVLIGFYNHAYFASELFQLNQTHHVLFSSVSLCEFIRGAHDKNSQEIVREFQDIVKDRIITPTKEHWHRCGFLSEKLLSMKKRSKEGVLLLQNDILIALCAHERQGTLVTADRKDFRLIQKVFDHSVDYWSTPRKSLQNHDPQSKKHQRLPNETGGS